MPKIMALDVGDRKIGVAITDLLGILPQPYDTIRFYSEEEKIDKIAKIIEENSVEHVVIGLPKNMDASEGMQAKRTREFAKKLLNKINIKIDFVDERLTTKKAFKDLRHLSVKKIKEKNILDTQAAINILETYLMKNGR